MDQTKNFSTEQQSDPAIIRQDRGDFILGRQNLIVMIVAAVLIVLGFALMAGAPSTETEFNPDIFSTRRIIVGPLLAFLGFVAMGAGIIIGRSKKHQNINDKTEND